MDKIARGLELNDDDRFRLLLIGLELSKRDFVIPDFTNYPPEIINFLPYLLNKSGINPSKVEKVELGKEAKQALLITTNQGL